MISFDFNNIAVITVKGIDCCCIFYGISKSDAIHLLDNSVLYDYGFIIFESRTIILTI